MDKKELYKNMFVPLKGKLKKYDFVGFDIETNIRDDGTQDFYSGGLFWYIDNKIAKAYFSPCFETIYNDSKIPEIVKYNGNEPAFKRMIRFMCSRKYRNKFIVATNLSFDLTGLFFDTEYWNNIHFIKRGSDILFASYNLGNNNGKIKFIDTFNYVPFSVESLGNIIGKSKLEKPSFWKPIYEDNKIIDYHVPKPKNMNEELDLMEYNLRDCEVSCDFAYFLQQGFNETGGNMKNTIASTSLDVYRRGYMKYPLIKENFILKDNIKPFIFDAYYGGRTETFERGIFDNKINVYDVNSLYPSVMHDYKIPIPQSVKQPKNPHISYIEFEGVTECTIEAPYMKYPVLPYRKDGKLIFPIGKMRGTWNNNEIRLALDKGYKIKELHKQIYYTKSDYLFRDYISSLYNKRLEYKKQDSPMELVQKLLMNSIYGKFAQRYMTQLNVKRFCDLDDKDKEDILFGDMEERDVEIFDEYVSEKKNKEFDGIFSFPILSSYISSLARIRMYKYIEKYEPIYMDTDSIFTEKYIESSKELGGMKHEYSSEHSIFIKPKMYMTNNKVKMKGVSRPDSNDMNKVLNGKNVKKMRFTKISESIKKSIRPNTKIIQTKKMSLEDNKRFWINKFDGSIQDSNPLVICDD